MMNLTRITYGALCLLLAGAQGGALAQASAAARPLAGQTVRLVRIDALSG
jgi:hypothetical protein